MSNQFLKLRRSAVPGKIPDTGSLDLGEIALNTYDGLAFMKKSVGGNESIVVIGNSTGSFTGSFTGEFTGSLLGTASWAVNAVTASTADNFFIRGNVTGSNALFTGTVTAQRLVVQTVSSSVIYSSGSNIFGDELTDTQQFTGSVTITGSLSLNNDPVVTQTPYNTFSSSISLRATNLERTASILTQASASFSSSISLLSGSFLTFSASYNTGSFTGSFTGVGNLTGSLFGTASWARNAVTASHAVTALSSSYAVSASNSSTASFAQTGNGTFSGSFSGSFFGNGAGLTNISASSVVGLNLSLISSGSVTASTDPAYGFRVNANSQFSGSTQITGSLGVTGSVSISGSVGSVFTTNIDTMILTGSFLQSGSTFITGTLGVFGGITGSLFGTSSWAVSASLSQTASLAILAPAYTTTASFNQFTGSYLINSSSFSSSIALLSASFLQTSSSYASASGSLSTRVSTLENASASFAQQSGSNSVRLTNLESTASVLTTASASFSSSIQFLSSSFIAFSQSYNTGSFTGSFNGRATLTGSFTGQFYGNLSGSFSGSVANIHGATNYIAKFDSPNSVDSSVIYQSSSHIAINETNFTSTDPEALYVFQTHPTSINVITGKGNLNNYLQLNIQNTNQGIQASSDIVATANNGNESSNYIDMGINSENFNTNFIGGANDAYVYSIANNLHIGNAATNGTHLGLFVGGTDVEANSKLQLNSVGKHIMSGSLAITGSLYVQQGVTASLYGTSSWAVSASHAPSALTSSFALSSSYAATASFVSGAVYTTGNQSIAGLKQFTSNTLFNQFIALEGSASTNYSIAFKQNSALSFYGSGYTSLGVFGNDQMVFDFNQGGVDYKRFTFSTNNITNNTSRIYYMPDKTGNLLISDLTTGSVGTASLALTSSQAIYADYATSASYALTASSADNFFVRQNITASNALIYGSLTAQTIYAQYITASTELITGSTKFGTQLANTHQFTGSVTVTGSLSLNNDPVITQTPYNAFSSSIQLRATNLEATSSILTSASASFAIVSSSYASSSGSLSIRTTNLESTASVLTLASASFATVSGSYASASGSLSTRVTTLEQASASFAQDSGSNSIRLTNLESTASVLTAASASFSILSSSFVTTSASLSTRTTNLESTASVLTTASASFAILSSSYASASGSLSTRTTNLESTASVLTTASASFAIVSSSFATTSASLSTRTTNLESTASILTTASASFALVSASYSAFSQSYNTGSFTGSFTGRGNLTGSLFGTASWAQNATTASFVLNAISASFATTASYAVSSSYAYNADLLDGRDSSAFATTGSNIFVGNQTVTGSLFTSGSNTLVGSTTLTGSLNISGSTVQIGSNTLAGNTTLSGSITISGSLASVPTIKIFGDVQQNGYLSFDPVTTNINNSISASYIYVSGSTNDLYFTQNGNGYANTTRLRWLEGNLYTGLLNGGLITSQSSTTYQVGSGSGIIVNLNASLNDNPYPTITYVNWPNLTGNINQFSASYDQTFVAISTASTLISQSSAFLNGQVDTQIPVGYVAHQDNSTINGTVTEPSLAYGWKQRSNVFISAFGPLKLSGFNLAVSGSSTGSLVVGSGTAFLDGGNYQTDPNNPSYVTATGTNTSRIFRYYESGSDWVYDTNAGAGYGAIDPARYSNNGTLSSVGAGNWSIQRVFFFPTSPLSPKPIIVYYGNAIYATEADAIANIPFEPFTEAPSTAAAAIYLGAIVISGNGLFTSPTTFTIYPGGLFRQVGGSGGGGSIVTQTLAGLSDVNISGPTNGQPLVYNNISGKWQNSSTLTATLTGNASTATTASFAVTASYVLNAVSASYALSASSAVQANTASYVLNAVSASFTSTASFANQASTASYVLNAVSASFASNASTASYVLQAVSASFASNASTASYVLQAVSASFATNASTASSADSFLVRQNITASNALITGTLTAQTIVAQFITSSTDFVTGSTKFGTLLTNTHQFTGSVTVTGSLSLNNSPVVTNDTLVPFSSSVSIRVTNLESTASVLTTASASFAQQSGSNSIRLTNLETTASVLTTASASFALVSASYSSASGSLSTRVTNLESTASVLTTASASFAQQSGSNSIRLTNLETTASVLTTASASFALVSASFASTSASLSIRTTNLESTASVLTTASASFSTRVTTLENASASFALVSGSYSAASQSFSTRVTSLETASGSFSTRVTTLENASASFAQQSGSNSIRLTNLESTASVLTTASASFALVSASYSALSGSFRSGSFTGSFTGTLIGTASWANNAVTSSYVLQAVSASFATTSSYSLTASVALNVPATASYALQALSASFATTASYAIAILDQGYNFTQGVAAVTWSINHNLNTLTPLVDTYDTSYNVIIPSTITSIDANNTRVTFAVATAGYAILSKGSGVVSNALSASQATSASYAISSSYAATASLVLGTIASASYATNADTASTGVNFRISNTLTLDATLTDYASVNSSVVGSNNLFTQATGSYTSAFFKYTVSNSTNARTGEMLAVWNGASVEFTDNSTLDIGSTTAVTCSVALVGSDVQFNVQTNTSGWRIKSLATFM